MTDVRAGGALLCTGVLAALLCVCSCTKSAYAQGKVSTVPGTTTVPSPEEQKLIALYATLTPRAMASFSLNVSDGAMRVEFIAELLELLAQEKTFAQNDKSLFFLIDKKHTVGSDYAPADLVSLDGDELFDVNKGGMVMRREARDALHLMARAALDDGVKLLVSSAYRSYSYQKRLFDYWVSVDGLEEAERESARPGTSQHQLGTAADFGSISDDFADTTMGSWMYANAARFGWSLSFPKGYEDVTGYRWECWHFRYIGKEACAFQAKWFGDVQQFMLEFIDKWKKWGS